MQQQQQQQQQQYGQSSGYDQQQRLYYQTQQPVQQQAQQMYNGGGGQLNQQHQQQQAQQLFAFQQAQIEMLQQQQQQLVQLAMQEQLLLQQQQALQAAQMAQAVQQQQQRLEQQQKLEQQQQQQASVAQYARSGQRSVSASPVVQQTTAWTGNEHDAAARQERWGGLRELQQARKQREASVPANGTQHSFSPPPPASAVSLQDWQAERMRAYEANSTDGRSGPATPVAAVSNAQTQQMHHRKNSSVASSASIQSLSISEAGSQFSPNRGPALVLSSPGEEFDEDDYNTTAGDEPTSPSISASMRAATIHERLSSVSSEVSSFDNTETIEAAGKEKTGRRSGGKKRHTVILSSSLPPFAMPAGDKLAGESSSEGGAFSGSSSPTESERSEVASFESAGTANTSAGNTSPTDANHSKTKTVEAQAAINAQAAAAAAFNPKAAAFRPSSASSSGTSTPATQQLSGASGPRYPSSLALRSLGAGHGASSSARIFTAPASSGASNLAASAITVIRQPKGPVDESELATKNFAGMIRRRAVGALRVATYTYGSGNGRSSPCASPVVGAFSSGGNEGEGLKSPPLGSAGFAGFGASLAERAMKRRSQQMQLGHGGVPNLGLGMY